MCYYDSNMTLPKVKNKKLIKTNEFAKVAKKVKKSFDEEKTYVCKKGLKNEDYLRSRFTYFS